MTTELARMLANELYRPEDAQLTAMRARARRLMYAYNTSHPDDPASRNVLLGELFGAVPVNCTIEPPFFCDYGTNIKLGKNVYMNFNCILLDCNVIEIGDNVMIAPNVQIYTAYHPLDATGRNSGSELAAPIKIGKNVWLGGNSTILPGVTIGDNAVIGAGSVVTRDVPENGLVVGNPAKLLKLIEQN